MVELDDPVTFNDGGRINCPIMACESGEHGWVGWSSYIQRWWENQLSNYGLWVWYPHLKLSEVSDNIKELLLSEGISK